MAVRVGVLRAAVDASELSDELVRAGFEPEQVPLFEVELLAAARPMIAAAAGDPDHWLVCPSPNSARAVAAARSSVRARVAVVGTGTEAAAHRVGLGVAHVAPAATALHLARSLPVRAGVDPVLVPQSTIARPDLMDELGRRGVRCRAVAAYSTNPLSLSDDDRQRLRSCSIHCLTAPSVLERLAAELDLEKWCAEGGRLVAIGPTTGAAIADAGLPTAAVANPHNVVGVVRAVRRVAR